MDKDRTPGVSVRHSCRVIRSGAIDFAELGDTVMMMDVDEGRYYELDPVGARIWALVESGPTVAEVCEALVAEYDVALDTCRDEVLEFMVKLNYLKVMRVLQEDGAEEDGAEGEAGTTKRPAVSSPPSGISRDAAQCPRSGEEPRAKLAWTTPVIRTMEVTRRTAGGPGPYTVENLYEHPIS